MSNIDIDEADPPREPEANWDVDARWLLALDEFNEWMNEEDYLTDEDGNVRQQNIFL